MAADWGARRGWCWERKNDRGKRGGGSGANVNRKRNRKKESTQERLSQRDRQEARAREGGEPGFRPEGYSGAHKRRTDELHGEA